MGHCYGGGCANTNCMQPEYTLPVLDYRQCAATPFCGESVTGGYVYRGCELVGWQGRYFFADFTQGWVRSFSFDPGTRAVSDIVEHTGSPDFSAVSNPGAFGEDARGEIYLLDLFSGEVHRVVPR